MESELVNTLKAIVLQSYSENAQKGPVLRVSNLNCRKFLKKIRKEQPLLYKLIF